MEFAKSMYSMFDNSTLGLKLYKNDVFAVTDEIRESAVYQQGVATRNFVPVKVGNIPQLMKVVNLTDSIETAFRISMNPVVQEVIEPVPPVEEQIMIIHGDESEDKVSEPEIDNTPNVSKMKYSELQTYAKELEKQFKIQIDRGAKKADLLKEVKAVIKDKM